ncbi:hypothetical protein CEXT_731601 [Caerostris extrusa]|uniref:Uncharacterized protein n=1 Tax=Caerostris extrusa TaxID=172846 RepID=A0AAV4NLQ2_CAEEX|nr:hypothetical protein CEXT_731601 [Caerostris extrusa]
MAFPNSPVTVSDLSFTILLLRNVPPIMDYIPRNWALQFHEIGHVLHRNWGKGGNVLRFRALLSPGFFWSGDYGNSITLCS